LACGLELADRDDYVVVDAESLAKVRHCVVESAAEVEGGSRRQGRHARADGSAAAFQENFEELVEGPPCATRIVAIVAAVRLDELEGSYNFLLELGPPRHERLD